MNEIKLLVVVEQKEDWRKIMYGSAVFSKGYQLHTRYYQKNQRQNVCTAKEPTFICSCIDPKLSTMSLSEDPSTGILWPHCLVTGLEPEDQGSHSRAQVNSQILPR